MTPDVPYRAPNRWAVGVDAGLVYGSGGTPGWDWGIDASLQARRPGGGFGVLAGITEWAERRALVGPTAGVAVNSTVARLSLCRNAWRSRADAYELDACGVAEVGWLRVAGFGFDMATRQNRATAAVGAGATLRRQLGRGWFAALGARVMVPLARDRIGYADVAGDVNEVFRTPPVTAVGALNFGVMFDADRSR